jgi:hypothetical protein
MGPSRERTSQMTVLIPARPQSSGGAQIWLFRAPKADAELVRTLSSYWAIRSARRQAWNLVTLGH